MIDPTPWIGPAFEVLNKLKDAGYLGSGKSRLKRTFNLLVKGELQVAVFGAGGTGKSTLSELLIHCDPQMLNPKYKMSYEVETKKIPGEVAARFQVVPGQDDYVKIEWPKVFNSVQNARRTLIFNVVSFGYHTFGETGKFTATEAPREYFTDKWRQAFDEYVAGRRRKEIDLLKVLCLQLETVKSPVRMTTIVTKEDLWWSEIESVRSFYEAEYLEQINTVKAKRESKGLGFQHSFITVSQVHANLDMFRREERRVVKPTAEGYDGALHLSSVYKLLQAYGKMMEG